MVMLLPLMEKHCDVVSTLLIKSQTIHMVSAWSTANGVVLGQEKTAEKSNEITAIPELLNSLAINHQQLCAKYDSP